MDSLTVKIATTGSIDAFQDEERNFFGEVWNSAAFTIGIRNPLVPDELRIIHEFLLEHFKTITLNDVREAFSLYSAQKLTFKDSHYNSLDNTFIGKVLTSYKEYNARQSLIRSAEEVIPKTLPRPQVTKEENAQQWFDWVMKETKYNKIPMIADWNAIYWHLNKKDLVSLSYDEKEMLMDNLMEDLKEEISQYIADRKDVSVLKKRLKDRNYLRRECRKRTVINYFTQLHPEK